MGLRYVTPVVSCVALSKNELCDGASELGIGAKREEFSSFWPDFALGIAISRPV